MFAAYLLPKKSSSSSFLAACKRLDMKESPPCCRSLVLGGMSGGSERSRSVAKIATDA